MLNGKCDGGLVTEGDHRHRRAVACCRILDNRRERSRQVRRCLQCFEDLRNYSLRCGRLRRLGHRLRAAPFVPNENALEVLEEVNCPVGVAPISSFGNEDCQNAQ